MALIEIHVLKFLNALGAERYHIAVTNLVGAVIKIVITLMITSPFPTVCCNTLICSTAFYLYKLISGGFYNKNHGQTILLTCIMLISLGIIADTFQQFITATELLSTILFMWSCFTPTLLIAFFFVPEKDAQITNMRKITLHKIASITVLTLFMFACIDSLSASPQGVELIISIWCGVVCSSMNYLPFISTLTSKMNSIIRQGEEK